jgi:hypothetical protein
MKKLLGAAHCRRFVGCGVLMVSVGAAYMLRETSKQNLEDVPIERLHLDESDSTELRSTYSSE